MINNPADTIIHRTPVEAKSEASGNPLAVKFPEASMTVGKSDAITWNRITTRINTMMYFSTVFSFMMML